MKKNFITVFLIILCMFLSGCSKKNDKTIVGKWETKLDNYSFVYTFNKDKTCSYDVAGSIMKCTYKVDGNKLSILYEGNTASFDTTFKIDGNKFIMKDSLGEDVIYKRK